jgi:hypothetical protein
MPEIKLSAIPADASIIATKMSPLPRNTEAKNRSSWTPSRSRTTPMNQRKAMLANGTSRRAASTELLRREFESHAPASAGSAGTATLISTIAVRSSTEKAIPAIPAARGVLSARPILGSSGSRGPGFTRQCSGERGWASVGADRGTDGHPRDQRALPASPTGVALLTTAPPAPPSAGRNVLSSQRRAVAIPASGRRGRSSSEPRGRAAPDGSRRAVAQRLPCHRISHEAEADASLPGVGRLPEGVLDKRLTDWLGRR